MKRYLKIVLLFWLVLAFYTYRNLSLAEKAQVKILSHLHYDFSGSLEAKTLLVIKYSGIKFVAGIIQ